MGFGFLLKADGGRVTEERFLDSASIVGDRGTGGSFLARRGACIVRWLTVARRRSEL